MGFAGLLFITSALFAELILLKLLVLEMFVDGAFEALAEALADTLADGGLVLAAEDGLDRDALDDGAVLA